MIELIYPSVCGICEEINKDYLCEKCKNKILKYSVYEIEDYRDDKKVYYDYKIKILKYENIVRDKIIEYKFNEKTYIHRTFEKIILNDKKIYSFLKKYDIILPVPLYKNKKWERGYNQTELIAKDISKRLGLTLNTKILKKVRDTKKQSTLAKAERIENVKDAFSIVNAEKIKGKNIIIFDDIYTTGSTLNECSRILKNSDIGKIAILTIAVD